MHVNFSFDKTKNEIAVLTECYEYQDSGNNVRDINYDQFSNGLSSITRASIEDISWYRGSLSAD